VFHYFISLSHLVHNKGNSPVFIKQELFNIFANTTMCNLTSTDFAQKVYQVVIPTDVRLHRQWDHVGNFTGIFFDLRHDNSHDDILCHPGKVFTRDTKKEVIRPLSLIQSLP
jgi:hypothetical protein